MNRMQKVVLYAGIAAAVLMTLFPPWTLVYKVGDHDNPGKYSLLEKPAQYRFIAFPCKGGPGRFAASDAHLDICRLGVQLIAVGIVTAGLMLILKGRKTPLIDRAKVKRLAVLVTVPLIILAIGTTVVWMAISMEKPIPLSPSARLEVKIAEKESVDGLTPLTLELNNVGTVYLHDEAALETSDIAAVYETKDQMDRLAIGVVLTKAGRKRMWSMTSSNIDKYAVIFVNGEAVSAPMITAAVDNKFIITGSEEKMDGLFQALTQP